MIRRRLFIAFCWPCFATACTEDLSPERPLLAFGTGGAAAADTGVGGVLASGGSLIGSGGLGVDSTLAGGQPSTSGGAATGGAATGGAATGGAATGGAATGGATTNSGGAGVGGATSIGGTSAGGSETGGAGTGGVSPGGAFSGGAGGSAGEASGGQPPVILPYGYAPTTVVWADAQQAYDEWKSVHLEDCGGGVYRVPWENGRLDATVSEGIGYGMLLTVAHGDQSAFDGLYAYYNKALDEYGLMHWLRYGCDAHWDLTYNEYPDNAAADADLDVAMSLIMASCKWGGNYGGEATKVINAIEGSMIGWDGDVSVLQPGDSAFFDNNGCINYSYFAPGYFRAFAQHIPGNAAFWNKLADDSYVLLGRASDPTTGLVRNWGSTSGGSVDGCTFDYSDDYGDDAARTPWRVGTDYLWWGNAQAKAWADKVTAWVTTQSLPDLGQWYRLDGTLDSSHDGYADHTAINIGPWAVGAMAHSQAAADALAAELLAIPTGAGSHDAEYFPRMLRALSLVAMTGEFTMCGGE